MSPFPKQLETLEDSREALSESNRAFAVSNLSWPCVARMFSELIANETRARTPDMTDSNGPDSLRDPRRVALLGIPMDALTMEETVDRVAEIVACGQPRQLVVVNSATFVLAWKDSELTDAVSGSAIVSPDGQSVVWASRLLSRPVPERIAGPDLFLRLVEASAKHRWRCFFLGAEGPVVEEAVRRLSLSFPQLSVAGYSDGYWTDDDEVIGRVRDARPDLLFLAVPSPRKELWLADNLERLGVPLVMGVGGVFDIVAGKTARAPHWMQRVGMEWIYRLLQEPRRLFRRYLVSNSVFVYGVFRALTTGAPERNPFVTDTR